MEWYDYLKDKWNIDTVIVAIVFLAGFFQEKYLCRFKWSNDNRFDAGLKTLVVSIIVSTLYIFLVYREAQRTDENAFIPWGKYLISWFTATSLYDMGIRPLRKWIKKKTGDDSPDPIDPPVQRS